MAAAKRSHAQPVTAAATSKLISELIDADLWRRQARWIRDDLEPMIAKHGPASLSADQIFSIERFFHLLHHSRPTLEHLRFSRIHLAVYCVASPATRWPGRLVSKADKLLQQWRSTFGDLTSVGFSLYEQGGRLHGICEPADISKEALELKWAAATDTRIGTFYSRRHGELDFTPGDWWINAMFAYHAGIIDSGVSTGRIISDRHGAYALILAANDEFDSPVPEIFTYYAKHDDPGRFRLTAGTADSRQPIRVLRTHCLRSFWAPQAGMRYDGLYKVTGWSVKHDPCKDTWTCGISFALVPDKKHPMKGILRHPLAEEVDDYLEYKRIRQHASQYGSQTHGHRPLPMPQTDKESMHSSLTAASIKSLVAAGEVTTTSNTKAQGTAAVDDQTADGHIVTPSRYALDSLRGSARVNDVFIGTALAPCD